ncbi:MAG: hypothetical protein ACM3Q4_05840 [Acidobacteriota bacterium]
MFRHVLILSVLLALLALSSCSKDLSIDGDTSTIDPALVAVWYNRADTVGFEAHADGSTRTLTVNTQGRLQYMPAADTVKRGTIILTIKKTEGPDIHLHMVYRIPRFIDTTVSVVGTYRVSANKDTLHLTIPDPETAEPIPLAYNRSEIGALVVPPKLSKMRRQ